MVFLVISWSIFKENKVIQIKKVARTQDRSDPRGRNQTRRPEPRNPDEVTWTGWLDPDAGTWDPSLGFWCSASVVSLRQSPFNPRSPPLCKDAKTRDLGPWPPICGLPWADYSSRVVVTSTRYSVLWLSYHKFCGVSWVFPCINWPCLVIKDYVSFLYKNVTYYMIHVSILQSSCNILALIYPILLQLYSIIHIFPLFYVS